MSKLFIRRHRDDSDTFELVSHHTTAGKGVTHVWAVTNIDMLMMTADDPGALIQDIDNYGEQRVVVGGGA